MTASTLAWYHYPTQYRRLLANTADHELRVLHADGLYRHLRFQRPGTSIWSWDLVTWPGNLAIKGDIGEGLIFSREDDMLRFFDHGQPDGHINAGYWAEKLSRGSRDVMEFSPVKFRRWVKNQDSDIEDDPFVSERESAIESTDEAIAFLNDLNICWDYEDPESWRDYRYHFILALHAILWGAKKYHAEVTL